MHLSSYLRFPLLITTTSFSTLPLSCATNNGIMTTPTYGTTFALFTTCAQTTILAPPSLIYTILLDFPLYPLWNKFVYSVSLPTNITSAADVYVGMPMTLHNFGLVPGLNTSSDEEVTYLEPDLALAFMAWRYNPGPLEGELIWAEHVTVLVDLGEGKTKYIRWDTFYGIAAVAALPLRANLKKEFEIQAMDLKGRVKDLLG